MSRLKLWAGYLVRSEIWIVGLAVGATFLSQRLLPWAALLAALYWPLRWAAHKRLSVRTPADWGIILMALLLPVTLWATALPETTIPQVYRLLTGIGLFYAVANWAERPIRLRWLAPGFVAAGVGLAAFATISTQWAVDKLAFIPAGIYARFSVLVADAVHPNVMAGSLVLLLPLAVALPLYAWRAWKWWGSGLIWAAAAGMAGILVITQSRGGVMAVAASVLLLIILRWRWGWLALPLAGLAAWWGLREIGGPQALELILGGSAFQGAEGRIEVWSRAIYMIQDFSFTGIGIGSFGPVADILYPFFLAGPGSTPHAHNLFLQVAADLGIPGLLAWLAILWGVTACAWGAYRHGRVNGDGMQTALGAALLASNLALAVHGIFDAVTWGMVRPAPLVWGLWGLAVAAYLVQARTAPA